MQTFYCKYKFIAIDLQVQWQLIYMFSYQACLNL